MPANIRLLRRRPPCVIALASITLMLFVIFSPLSVATGIEDDREALYQRYYQGKLPFDAMVSAARHTDSQTRQRFMRQLGVAANPASAGDSPVRTGSDPTSTNGRGVFSDEDLECQTNACIDHVLTLARQHHLHVTETPLHYKIEEWDIKIWKPEQWLRPPFSDRAAYYRFALTIAQDDEYALGAKYGGPPSQFSMESILENLTKGHLSYTKPPSAWGPGHHQYEELIQLAKNTIRSMEAAGLCSTQAQTCDRLKALRKMQTSPEALGIFRPGDSPQTLEAALVREQQEMLALMNLAWQAAYRQLKDQVLVEHQAICRLDPDSLEWQATQKRAQETQAALFRIAVRYQLLFQRFPQLMQALTDQTDPLPWTQWLSSQIELLAMELAYPPTCDCRKRVGTP